MRLLLTVLVFLASLVAAVFVHAAKADAAWDRPQQIDSGNQPKVRLVDGGEKLDPRPLIAYARGDSSDPSQLLLSEGNEPVVRVKVPRAGRVVAFDADGKGGLVALREVKDGKRKVLALVSGRWRRISGATSSIDAKLAVADSGAAVAAWLQKEEGHWVVHAAVRVPHRSRFGPVQRLSGLTSRGGQALTVAITDTNTAVVTWSEAGDLTLARTVGGPAFTAPVRVHDRTSVVAGALSVASAVRGDTAVVAFTRLEDREPPEYRLSVATQVGDTAPVVETVASDVSGLDVDAAFDHEGAPVVLSAPIGPPYSLRIHRRTASWAEAAAIPATEAPSTVAYSGGAVTWTEGTKGFAWVGGQTLALGRAYNPAASAIRDGRAFAVWDRGPGRSMRLATFTP